MNKSVLVLILALALTGCVRWQCWPKNTPPGHIPASVPADKYASIFNTWREKYCRDYGNGKICVTGWPDPPVGAGEK